MACKNDFAASVMTSAPPLGYLWSTIGQPHLQCPFNPPSFPLRINLAPLRRDSKEDSKDIPSKSQATAARQ